jgi:hypothetical protein
MTATQIEALFQLAIATGMVLLGLGVLRLPPNPNFRLFDPAGLFFKRLMLVGGVCVLVVALTALFGIR